jgi:Tfp pilus assembly protein PilF
MNIANFLLNLIKAAIWRWVQLSVLWLLLLAPVMSSALEVGGGCGNVGIGFVYDYRPEKFKPNGTFTSVAQPKKLLEDAHFTVAVETLERGKSSVTAGPDLSYLLRHMPNHYRGLLAMVRLGKKEGTSQPKGSEFSIECWFKRATAWVPDDNTVKMLYAQYLYGEGRSKDAEDQLEFAARQAGDNPFTNNNIGLIYFDAKNYDRALRQAHRAYAAGFTNPTLREKLQSVGKWTDDAVAPNATSASAAD